MEDPAAEYFDALGRHRYEPLLEKVDGTIRFDLHSGESTDYFCVAVQRGEIRVSQEVCEADCIIHTDRALFDRIVIGAESAIASLLRGTLVVEGELHLFFLIGRLLGGRLQVRSATAQHTGRSSS